MINLFFNLFLDLLVLSRCNKKMGCAMKQFADYERKISVISIKISEEVFD